MTKFKFELNTAGVREILRSEGVQAMLTNYASGVKQRCGLGYQQDIYVGRNRANAQVWPDTIRAKRSNLKHNTLLKAVR